jgi:hypothetical protein
MSEQEKQEIIANQSQAVVLGSPALGLGHEETTDQGDIEIPRAKLIQAMSDEAQAANPADRATTGTVINSLTKEVLPSIFIPIMMYKNYIRWNSRRKDDPNFDPAFEPGELVFTTTNRQEQRVQDGINFGPNGEPPTVTQYMNFLCYFIGHPMPVLLSFSKSSYSAGVRLNSLTKFFGGNMFDSQYKLAVSQREADGSKFFVYEVLPGGIVSEDNRQIAKNWYDKFRGATIRVQPEKPEDHSGSFKD